jgi:hypothetical protein
MHIEGTVEQKHMHDCTKNSTYTYRTSSLYAYVEKPVHVHTREPAQEY